MTARRETRAVEKNGESGIRLSAPDFPRLNDDEDTEVSRTTAMIAAVIRSCRRPRITIMAGLDAGKTIALDEKEEFVLGRHRGDITIADEGVSRRHCRFIRRDNCVFVQDLGSRNGTVVNGAPITCAQLFPGDRIHLGLGVLLQYTELDETEDELVRRLYAASTLDPLTGAFTRKHFCDRLEVEVSYARRHQKPLSVILFDIDKFKDINDSLGHAAGDEVLRTIVRALFATVRGEDVLTRYGGEEFALLVRDTALPDARRFADRIRTHVAELQIAFEGRYIRATISAGVAELSECDSFVHGSDLLRLADERLYRAKGAGRNCTCTS